MRPLAVPAILSLLFAAPPPRAAAQIQASLGGGVGTVRYAGGSSFSAATLSPAIQVLGGRLFVGAGGSLSTLPKGVVATQGRAELWASAPTGPGRLELAVGASLVGSDRSDGDWTLAGHGTIEALWPADRWGIAVGAGPSFGDIERAEAVTALRLRLRTWWQPGGRAVQYTASAEPQRFLGGWFTDLTGGATVDRGRIVGSVWGIARLSGEYGSKAGASAFLQLFVTPHVAVEAAAGGFLADPYQGFPRAGYVSAGVRVHRTPRALQTRPPPPTRRARCPRLLSCRSAGVIRSSSASGWTAPARSRSPETGPGGGRSHCGP
ncbi:MAG: hypothetical protein ACREL9_12810 [Gemmatimonadales bacterium]